MLGHVIDALHRREGGKILAGLIRRVRDFDLAEEALQDAYSRAMARWPRDGMPDNPAAWLTVVAQRRAIDLLRERARVHPHSDDILSALTEEAASVPASLQSTEAGLDDDRLRLIFTCCHPALAPSAQAALALRTICRLTTREIARAFVEPEATTAQKLVRAKRKIATANIPFVIPDPSELPGRLAVVLAVIYLLFNEGYSPADHDHLTRPDLCAEAIRLARLLVDLLPDEPEVSGLLALMLLHDSRRTTRRSEIRALVPLEEQDRTAWNKEQIAEATTLLEATLRSRQPGAYQIQAAIAALHANAATAEATDWPQIAVLYRVLLTFWSTPVVELNAAVAHAMAASVDEGLCWIKRIELNADLDDYHLLHAATADLLRRSGRWADAANAYRRALELTTNHSEHLYLQARLQQVQANIQLPAANALIGNSG